MLVLDNLLVVQSAADDEGSQKCRHGDNGVGPANILAVDAEQRSARLVEGVRLGGRRGAFPVLFFRHD